MMALFNNWDIKDTNNKIGNERASTTRPLRAALHNRDLGASFGKVKSMTPRCLADSRPSPSNEPRIISIRASFADVKEAGFNFYTKARVRSCSTDIKIEEAKWVGGLLSRLAISSSETFPAANYPPEKWSSLREAVRRGSTSWWRSPQGARVGREPFDPAPKRERGTLTYQD